MEQLEKTRWITRTAALTALLILLQGATAALGNTLITGSIVNLLLIVSVMTGGLSSGMAVAFLSPVLAKLVGIGPLWSLIPFIVLGNLTLVAVWHRLGDGPKGTGKIAALLLGAVAKFLVLYIGIVKLAVPILLKLPQKQAVAVSALFSLPQLITALLGGVGALMILIPLKKAVTAAER